MVGGGGTCGGREAKRGPAQMQGVEGNGQLSTWLDSRWQGIREKLVGGRHWGICGKGDRWQRTGTGRHGRGKGQVKERGR